ncbi:helix-turn-helix domain-containing protein [Metabacillus idriensis]|uniref:helix-turn-helix domain-containing protein n=1 Tax=Metabacillus idriensis TaxID=324768 RepID=UPI00174E1EC8|nr:tetratricopeptide repeat protein [Metabacillus idriensis]
MNTVGMKLRQLRKKQKLTQNELATGIVNRSYISQLEKGMVQPSYKLLLKFSERLQCDIHDFFEEEDKSLLSFDLKKALTNLEFSVVNNEFADAEELLNDLTKNIESLNQGDLALYYFCKGKIHQQVNHQIEEAIAAYEKSYELFCSLQYTADRLRTSNHLVHLLIKQNLLSKAFSYLNEAYDDSITHKASGVEKISLLNNLGIAHAKKGEYYSAIRFLKQTIGLSSKTNIYYHTGNVYMVLGLCYRRMNDYENASQAYAKALLFFEGTNDELNLAGTYTNLGILSRYLLDADSAMNYLASAHEIYIKMDDLKGILNTLYELALTYYEANQDDKVLESYKQFQKINSTEFSHLKYKFISLIGDMHHRNNDQEEALRCYHEILDNTGKIQESMIIKDVLKKMAEIAYISRNEKTLFYLLEKYLKL